MTVRLNSKLIDASPNVVRLPTASSRQPDNYRYAAQRQAMRSMRQAEPWPGEYRQPQQREALKRAAVMREVRQTPELTVLLMLLENVPREQRQSMIEKLALRAVVCPMIRQAVEIIRSTMLNFGEQWDLMNAMNELADGGTA